MVGRSMADSDVNSIPYGEDFPKHKPVLMSNNQRNAARNTSDFVTENTPDFLVVQIPSPEEGVDPAPSSSTPNVRIHIEAEPLMANGFDNELDHFNATATHHEGDRGTESFPNEVNTAQTTRLTETYHDFDQLDDGSEQIIQFQGDLRDYTGDRRGLLSTQRSFESDQQTNPGESSHHDSNDIEELEEGPGSLYDALIQPYYSTRYRLKSLALAVSRSLPSSPRFRNPKHSRYSQSALPDSTSKSHRLIDRQDENKKANIDAETILANIDCASSSQQDEGQEERPKSTSPRRPKKISQMSLSPEKMLKPVVTKSTSTVDVSSRLSTSPMLGDSHVGNNLPRSTSTPGLSSSYGLSGLSGVGRRPARVSTGTNLRELGGQPWSLSRAESLAEANGFQHCIVCRACSSRAKQIRPGRHFVLSWKQILAMIFALSVYIAGGTLLFIQLEYTAETKRQDNFIRFFKGFVANHSCVGPHEVLHMADTLLKDPNLAILMLREMSANYEVLHKQTSAEFDGGQATATFTAHENNSSVVLEKSGLVQQGDSSRCFHHMGEVNNSTHSLNNCEVWTSTARIWGVPNSLGFVISALTTIGYGMVAPRTPAGRLTCVAYGVVGIPLMLLFLGGIGEQMRRMTSRFIMRKRIFPCGKRFNQALNTSLLGMVGLMLLFMVPSIAFVYMEGWSVVDAVYYCFISLSTIGFGDLMLGDPTSQSMANSSAGHQLYRVMSLVWVLFGLAYVGMCITSLAHLIIRGSCGANNVETMRLKTELKRLKHEIRAQRMYTRRSGLSMWTSQMASDREGPTRWDFDLIAEDGDGQKY